MLETPEKPMVLVVDDDELVRKTYERVLKDQYSVITAGSVDEATGLLAQNSAIAAIVSDLMMPKKTGKDLYEWIKGNRRDLAGKIVFCTGGAFTDEMREFKAQMEEGGRVLDKPVMPETLKAKIAELIAGVRGQTEKAITSWGGEVKGYDGPEDVIESPEEEHF